MELLIKYLLKVTVNVVCGSMQLDKQRSKEAIMNVVVGLYMKHRNLSGKVDP
jgi:hypothetical protein